MENRRVDKNQTFSSILLGISKHKNCKSMDKKLLLRAPKLLGRSWISFLRLCHKIGKHMLFPNLIPKLTWSRETITLRPSKTCWIITKNFMKTFKKSKLMKSKKMNSPQMIAHKVHTNSIRRSIGSSKSFISNKKIAMRLACLLQKQIISRTGSELTWKRSGKAHK